jgi:hypothetical protein|tara:strand:+ start:178 stop:480 length:303 start_codon:yes stop_codon:yes gene_type:complete
MIRLVFASCLLLILSSCSGIAGLAFTAASSAKSTYDGYKFIEKKVNEKKTKKNVYARQGWFQIHEEGIWYGSYIMLERRNYRIYGNPRDKEKYLDDNATP